MCNCITVIVRYNWYSWILKILRNKENQLLFQDAAKIDIDFFICKIKMLICDTNSKLVKKVEFCHITNNTNQPIFLSKSIEV